MSKASCCLAAAIVLAAPGLTGQTTEGPRDDGIRIELPGSRRLKASGELRWRAEHRNNYDFRDNAGSDPSFADQRARAAFDFDVNEVVRAFLQLQDARTFGEEVDTIDRSADGLDLHQGFLDWIVWPERDGRLRIGRQEILLGDERLVSPLNWATQGRSFDGARFDFEACECLDLLAFATVLRQDKFQNDNQGSYFGGIRASGEGWDDRVNGDVYLFFLLDEETPANGTANRWTLGTRVKSTCGGFDAGFEGALQFGEQDNADIPFGECYAVHFEGGYSPESCPWSPRIGAEYDFATGNDPTSNDNERFDNLFPLAHAYFGYMDFALWENVSHFAVVLVASPGAKTKIHLSWHNFHSHKTTDRFGGPSNVLSTGAAGASHMGDEFDLTCRHDLGHGIWGEAGAGVFLAGDGVRDARGDDDTALFLYYMMGIKI